MGIVAAMKKAGLSVKPVGYDPSTTDLTGPLTAAGAQTADVIVLQDIATGCVNLAKALTQLGLNKKVLTNPLCLDPRVAHQFDDRALTGEGRISDHLAAAEAAEEPPVRTAEAVERRQLCHARVDVFLHAFHHAVAVRRGNAPRKSAFVQQLGLE